MAQVVAEGRRITDGGHAVRVHSGAGRGGGGKGDTQWLRVGVNLNQERPFWWRCPVRVTHIGFGGSVKQGGAVPDRACEGMLNYKPAEYIAAVRTE
jgi:hypothetical protein